MQAPVAPRSKITQFEVRKKWLENWFKEHTDATVTLMAFSSSVTEPLTCNLADPIPKAQQWLQKLKIQNRGGTHLWEAVSKAVDHALNLTRNEPGSFATLHVLTDSVDTQRVSSSLDSELKSLRHARTIATAAESIARGDFDLRVSAQEDGLAVNNAIPNPGPAELSSLIAPTSSPTATPAVTMSPAATPRSATAATSTPEVDPAAVTRVVGFEIQEPRIVSSGQFVHLANRTFPPAKAYTWTIRHNPPPPTPTATQSKPTSSPWWKVPFAWFGGAPEPTSVQSEPEPNQVNGAEKQFHGEHPVFQFRNDEIQPRSYTVLLTAQWEDTSSAGTPTTILVQALPRPPKGWEKILKWSTALFGGTTLAGLVSVLTTVIKLRDVTKKKEPIEEVRRERKIVLRQSLARRLAVTALSVALLVFVIASMHPSPENAEAAAQQTAAEAAARAQAVVLSSAPLAPSGSTSGNDGKSERPIIIAPSESVAAEAAEAVAPRRVSIARKALIAAIVIAIVAVLALIWRERATIIATTTPTAANQVDEINSLVERKILSVEDGEAVKAAIVNRLRKQYGLPKASSARHGPSDPAPPPESEISPESESKEHARTS